MAVDARPAVRTLSDMTTRSLAAVALSLALAGCAVAAPTDLRGRSWQTPAQPANCATSMVSTLANARRCNEAGVSFPTDSRVDVEVAVFSAECSAVARYSGRYEVVGDLLRLTGPIDCNAGVEPYQCSAAGRDAEPACAVLKSLEIRLSRDGTALVVRDSLGRTWSPVSR